MEPKLDEVATDAVQGRFPLLGRKINDEGILQEYEVAGEKSQEFWRKALGRRLVKDVVQGDISAAGVECTHRFAVSLTSLTSKLRDCEQRECISSSISAGV